MFEIGDRFVYEPMVFEIMGRTDRGGYLLNRPGFTNCSENFLKGLIEIGYTYYPNESIKIHSILSHYDV